MGSITVYAPVRRGLNFLFNASISSLLYIKIYGNYQWYDITDYKSILNFFLRGEFFIPFSIFVSVYAITEVLSVGLFSSLTRKTRDRLMKTVLAFEIKKENTLDADHLANIILSSGPEFISKVYNSIKSNIKNEDLILINKGIAKGKTDLERNFILFLRAFIAVFVYFITLPQFGVFLLILLVVMLIVGLLFTVVLYTLLETLPEMFRRLGVQIEEYLKEMEKGEDEE